MTIEKVQINELNQKTVAGTLSIPVQTAAGGAGSVGKVNVSALSAFISNSLTLSGDVVGPLSATSITDNVITNTKLAKMGQYTVKGNNTGFTDDPTDISASDLNSMLGLGSMAFQNSNNVSITGGSISNNATTATSANTPNTIMLRNNVGEVSASTFIGNLDGNAATATFATSATTSVTATNATNVTGSFGGSGGDISGTQPTLTVRSSAITNAKMANMNALTLKGNNTGLAGPALDLSVSAVQAMLGIGSATLTATQVGFGDVSNSLTGSPNFTWNNTTLTLALANNSLITMGNGLLKKKFSIYQAANNNFQFCGWGVTAGLFEHHIADVSNDFVYFAGLNSTSEAEAFRIKGSGGFLCPSINAIAVEPFIFTGAPHILTFTFTAPWASNRTHPFSFYRIGRMVIMKWPDLAAQSVSVSGAIQSATANGSVFVPSIYYPATSSGRPVSPIKVYNNGNTGETGDIQFGATTFGYNIVIRADNGAGFVGSAGFPAGVAWWFV